MPNEISDLPTPKNFGLDFNYASWSANTELTMCNVPWNNDYRDVVRFSNQGALDSYLEGVSGPKIKMLKTTQLKWGQPIDIDVPFNVALEFNYLKVSNSLQPIPGDKTKSYYYFVQHVEYIAPNTTRLYIQVDAWQTFIYTTTFGNCFVERGHVGIANSNGFNNWGRDYLTSPEGMDIGGEYQIVRQYSEKIASARDSDYDIMVITTVPLDQPAGTTDKPILKSSKGSNMQNLPNGAEIYVFLTITHFKKFLEDYSDRPWVTQGIISVTAIPHVGRYGVPVSGVTLPHSTAPCLRVDAGVLNRREKSLSENWREFVRTGNLPLRYRNLRKLMTFPYCVLELTSHTGTPLMIKPESWNDANATVIEVPHFAPPAPRLSFYPFRYNAASSSAIVTDANGVLNDGGEFLDMATGITNFPTFSTVNNSYAGFLASNANSLAYQHSSADYSQQKALNGAQLAQSQSGMGVSASQDLNNIGINAQYAQTNLSNNFAAANTAVNAVKGIAGGAAMGPGGLASGVAGAAMSGVSTAMNIAQNSMSTDISAGASRDSNNRSNSLTGQIADSNKGYADMVATGDYANTIAGINAKTQDAKMIQNTTSGQVGGDAFLLANYQWGYDLKVKLIDNAAMRTVGEFWLRYGYNIGTFMELPADFKVMNNFTYWKLKETYITSSRCPEEYRQTLRGILEKGVTVWSNPAHIGTIDIGNNTPLGGISY